MVSFFKPFLSHKTWCSKDIDESLIREMHEFRGRFIQLRPDISKEYDFKKFREFFTQGGNATVLRDQSGVIKTILGHRVDQVKAGRVLRRVFWAEYFFVDRHYRGHPLVTLSWLRICFSLFTRRLSSDFAIFANSFPASYLFGMSYVQTGRWHPVVGKPLAEPEKSMMDFCIREYLGEDFDPKTGLCLIRTIPSENPWTVTLNPEQQETLGHYEQMNPNWRSSLGLPALFYPSFYKFARGSVKRLIQRKA